MDTNQFKSLKDLQNIKDINEVELTEEQKAEMKRLGEEAKKLGVRNEKDALEQMRKMAADKSTGITDEKLDQFKEALSPILDRQQKRKLESIMKILKEKK